MYYNYKECFLERVIYWNVPFFLLENDNGDMVLRNVVKWQWRHGIEDCGYVHYVKRKTLLKKSKCLKAIKRIKSRVRLLIPLIKNIHIIMYTHLCIHIHINNSICLFNIIYILIHVNSPYVSVWISLWLILLEGFHI